MAPAKWRTGQAALKLAKRAKRWPDGAPLGKGFGSPYLQAEYAEQIGALEKPTEGRPGGGWLTGIKKNDYINFKVTRHSGHGLATRVRRVRHFPDFETMIKAVGLSNLLPGRSELTIANAASLYRSFRTQSRGSYAEIERTMGAVAIDVEPLEPTVEAQEERAVVCADTKLKIHHVLSGDGAFLLEGDGVGIGSALNDPDSNASKAEQLQVFQPVVVHKGSTVEAQDVSTDCIFAMQLQRKINGLRA